MNAVVYANNQHRPEHQLQEKLRWHVGKYEKPMWIFMFQKHGKFPKCDDIILI